MWGCFYCISPAAQGVQFQRRTDTKRGSARPWPIDESASGYFADVVCPIFILIGVFTRLTCLPIIGVLLVAMVFVHPEWSVAEGQFGWLPLNIFTTLPITSPGSWCTSINVMRYIMGQVMRRVCRREGGMNGAVYEGIFQPGIFVETFDVGSWIEHLRQQERYTMNDRKIQQRVQTFH